MRFSETGFSREKRCFHQSIKNNIAGEAWTVAGTLGHDVPRPGLSVKGCSAPVSELLHLPQVRGFVEMKPGT